MPGRGLGAVAADLRVPNGDLLPAVVAIGHMVIAGPALLPAVVRAVIHDVGQAGKVVGILQSTLPVFLRAHFLCAGRAAAPDSGEEWAKHAGHADDRHIQVIGRRDGPSDHFHEKAVALAEQDQYQLHQGVLHQSQPHQHQKPLKMAFCQGVKNQAQQDHPAADHHNPVLRVPGGGLHQLEAVPQVPAAAGGLVEQGTAVLAGEQDEGEQRIQGRHAVQVEPQARGDKTEQHPYPDDEQVFAQAARQFHPQFLRHSTLPLFVGRRCSHYRLPIKHICVAALIRLVLHLLLVRMRAVIQLRIIWHHS